MLFLKFGIKCFRQTKLLLSWTLSCPKGRAERNKLQVFFSFGIWEILRGLNFRLPSFCVYLCHPYRKSEKNTQDCHSYNFKASWSRWRQHELLNTAMGKTRTETQRKLTQKRGGQKVFPAIISHCFLQGSPVVSVALAHGYLQWPCCVYSSM